MSRNERPKLPGQDRIFYPPFTHDAQGHPVRRSLIPMQTVSWPHSLGDVTFTDVAQGTELCPLVLFESWTWPTETDCLLVQAEGTEGLYCDWRKAMHCPGALPWVLVLNVNCYKLSAITSLVSWIYYQQPALPIDLKVVLLYITLMWSCFSRLELLLIASFNNITASRPSWL